MTELTVQTTKRELNHDSVVHLSLSQTSPVPLNRSTQELEILIRARYPVIYVVSWEEARVEAALAEVVRRRDKKLYTWSIARGIQLCGTPLESTRQNRMEQGTTEPGAALDHVLHSMENAVYLFRDLHPFLRDVPSNIGIIRRVRELSGYLKNSYKTLILVSPTLTLPLELQKDVTVVEFDLPTRHDLGALLDRTLAEVNETTGRNLNLIGEPRERVLSAAAGLTVNEAENVFAKTLVMSGKLDDDNLAIILSEKEQMIRKSGLMEYYHTDTDLGQVGGMDVLKGWLEKRRVAFDARAAEWGLPAPRGVLLIGVQGCGKSLTAKSIAGLWGIPLLRLDVGKLMSGVVGSSEENMRSAIAVAESVAPAVLWIDEIEKSLAGSRSSDGSDGGTAARVLSTILTWLQEKTAPVFVVATANSIDQLPPELLRRGRLDETFFVDLPDTRERREIFAIHLERRNRPATDFNLETLAAATDGFSGAEIEQVIIAALFDAYGQQEPLTTDTLLTAVADMIPLSQTMQEPIARLRHWAEGRARRASSLTEEAEEPSLRRSIEMAPNLLLGARKLELED